MTSCTPDHRSGGAPLPLDPAERRHLECLARIHGRAVELALDLLVREPDIAGFFRAFTRTLLEEGHACGVWLMDDDERGCDLWMGWVKDRLYTRDGEWDESVLPRRCIAAHLFEYRPGWSRTLEYTGDDSRLPSAVREHNRREGMESIVVAPLILGTRTLGWMVLAARADIEGRGPWRVALLEACARQATLALYQSRLIEEKLREERSKAVLEERNRLARDIHDNLAQGFAAVLMQLQAARRQALSLPPAAAASLETAVDLARTHMIEARRSVGALRPRMGEGETLGAALRRLVEMTRRTTDVSIELASDELPPLGDEIEREIIAIAQEALTNAVQHARARRIRLSMSAPPSFGLRLSVADDGRGIARDRGTSGFGLTSMQERAAHIGASLTIVTAPRRGTEVVLAWQPAVPPDPEREVQCAT